jgi:hypothetical protein
LKKQGARKTIDRRKCQRHELSIGAPKFNSMPNFRWQAFPAIVAAMNPGALLKMVGGISGDCGAEKAP